MRLMSPARPCNAQSRPNPARMALTAACIAAATMAGGCGSTRTAETTHRQWVGAAPAPMPGQPASDNYKAEAGDPIKEAPVEPASRRAEPDDPSEPFSPNYGRGAAVRASNATGGRIATAVN
jgi:hypothetical protein